MEKYQIYISSDLDYEKMVVDIRYLNELIIRLTAEEGLGKEKVELFDKYKQDASWEFEFDEFLAALKKGYEKLKEANEFE